MRELGKLFNPKNFLTRGGDGDLAALAKDYVAGGLDPRVVEITNSVMGPIIARNFITILGPTIKRQQAIDPKLLLPDIQPLQQTIVDVDPQGLVSATTLPIIVSSGLDITLQATVSFDRLINLLLEGASTGNMSKAKAYVSAMSAYLASPGEAKRKQQSRQASAFLRVIDQVRPGPSRMIADALQGIESLTADDITRLFLTAITIDAGAYAIGRERLQKVEAMHVRSHTKQIDNTTKQGIQIAGRLAKLEAEQSEIATALAAAKAQLPSTHTAEDFKALSKQSVRAAKNANLMRQAQLNMLNAVNASLGAEQSARIAESVLDTTARTLGIQGEQMVFRHNLFTSTVGLLIATYAQASAEVNKQEQYRAIEGSARAMEEMPAKVAEEVKRTAPQE